MKDNEGIMKKICLLVGYYPINRGGAEYQAYLLAQRLREQHDVFYISPGQAREECIIDSGMKIYTLCSPRLLCFRDIWFLLESKILRILRRERPDIVYQRVGYSATGIAAKYCRESPCQLVWHIAHERDVALRRRRPIRRILFDRIENKYREFGIRHANIIIGQAAYQDRLLHRNYGRTCDLVVGNWLPLPSRPTVKNGPVTMVWIANLKPHKQPDAFIRLANRMRHCHDARFIMIGRPASGRYQKKLEKSMEGLPNLAYLGERSIDEVNEVLAGAHVFVNTSVSEGFPNTFVQAWLHQVPVVSLHVDPDDLLKRHGLGYHSVTFDDLVRDTKRLLDDTGLRDSMGKRGWEYALRYHSIEPNVAKLTSLLAGTH